MPKVRMKAATADAMQCLALGSILLERKPALYNLTAAYPSQTVHCPEPNIPTVVGPFFCIASLYFSAMMPKASSQVTGENSPFLSYFPFFLRKRGFVTLSLPYMILDRK